MASGSIMGDCPACGDLVWEDEWTLDATDRVCHSRCRAKSSRAAISTRNLRIMKKALMQLAAESPVAAAALLEVEQNERP